MTMQKTLHISLKLKDTDFVELRYFFDNPYDYTKRNLSIKSIHHLIDIVETNYYTVVPVDFRKTGIDLYRWLDSADRFLSRAIESCRGTVDVLVLAISTAGKMAHLPWEVLNDTLSFLVEKRNPTIVPIRWQELENTSELPANRVLQVLFMASSPINVEPTLDFEQEEGIILQATKKHPLSLIVEESGNLEVLRDL